MGNVGAPPDVFALQRRIERLTARATKLAAAWHPLIAELRMVDDAVATLVDRGAPDPARLAELGVDSQSAVGVMNDAWMARYDDWGRVTGYDELMAVIYRLVDELSA